VSSVLAVPEEVDPNGTNQNKNNVGNLSDIEEVSCESRPVPSPPLAPVSDTELQRLRSIVAQQNETIWQLKNEIMSLKEKPA